MCWHITPMEIANPRLKMATYYKEAKEEIYAGFNNLPYEELCEEMKKFKELKNG